MAVQPDKGSAGWRREWRALLLACQFLTSLPIRGDDEVRAPDIGRSLLWYAPVGLLLGLVLWALASQLLALPTALAAALLLTLWVWASGALHLDGLADSADAWLGGYGSRERTLEIMKDPRSGPLAVTVLVLLLLLKFAALQALLEQSAPVALALVPMLARMAAVLLLLTTPYVRAGGLAQALVDHMPRARCWQLLSLLVLAALAWQPVPAFCMLLAASLSHYALRSLMLRRLGGFTGDTIGASIEILELVTLLALVFALSGGTAA